MLRADLSAEHFIFDQVARAIVGIIDFSDMIVGDPDYEMYVLRIECGDPFLHRFFVYNPDPDFGLLLQKPCFFDPASNVKNIVLGLDRGNADTVENNLSAIERLAEAAVDQ